MAMRSTLARQIVFSLSVIILTDVAIAQSLRSSPVIDKIEWAPAETIVRRAKGGDNWPVTWADDSSIYSTYGDGYGFEPKIAEKLSMGFVRVDGDPETFRGVNLRSPDEQYGQGRAGKKAWGILSLDHRLYLWLGHADQRGGQAQLAWSDDHAKTWKFADWTFAEFGLIGFVNFGRDYEGARDDYVYSYSHDGPQADTPADCFVLMRAPKDRLSQRDAWEFFQRLDDSGQPIWSRDIEARGHVVGRMGSSLRSGMTFNAGIDRYLWWQQIPLAVGSPDRGDTRFQGGFVILDAAEPWGPWTVAYQTKQWDVGPGEHGDFPAKWMSPDGRTVHLVFSGDDCFCVRRAEIFLREASSQD